MNKGYLAVLALAATLGCATPTVVQNTDQFTGKKNSFTQGNELAAVSWLSEETGKPIPQSPDSFAYLALDLVKEVDESGTATYRFKVSWHRENGPFLSLKPGESLYMLIDGQRFAFSTKEGSAATQSKQVGWISPAFVEWAYYDGVSEKFIRQMDNAKTISVKVVGASRSLQAQFGEKNFKAIEDFIAANLTPAPNKTSSPGVM